MTTFFLDLWHDLREKRLWPVAVGLLAAIVAVPAVLFKPASDAAPQAVVAPKINSAETLPVVAVDSGPTVGSRLEAFKNEKNPFKPMKDLAKESSASGSSGASADSSSSGGGASSGSGGGSSTGGGSLPSSSSAGGSTAGGSGGSPSSAPSTGGPTTSTTTQWFHYTADFTFGKAGSPKKFKSAASFTLLPDKTKASIMFVGVTDDGKSAVFFIADPAFEAAGEGACNAKGTECRYVSLKLGDTNDEETFSAVDGSVSYDLKLTGIQREKVDAAPKAAADPAPDPAPAAPKEASGLGASGTGVSMATQTAAQSSESLLPDLLVGGPGVLRVGK